MGESHRFGSFDPLRTPPLLALPFLFADLMFPSELLAEPQGFALRPGPLPSAPFPVKGPAAPVGLAGLCSFWRSGFPGPELAVPAERRGVGFRFVLSVLPPGEIGRAHV